MNKNNKSLRLTERDIEYITWIAEQQAVRLDTLQLLFEIRGKKIDPRALRRLVERWQRLGLVQKKILLAKSPSIIWPTIEGMRVANLPLSRGFVIKNLAVLSEVAVVSRNFPSWST